MITWPYPIATSTDQLLDGLRALLAKVAPGAAATLRVEGEFPALSGLALDLSGASVRPVDEVRFITGDGGAVVGQFELGQAQVAANPIYVKGHAAQLHITAEGLRVQFVEIAPGQLALRLAEARQGQMVAQVARSVVEQTLLAESAGAAGEHGITIKEVQTAWSSPDPRRLAIEMRIKVKKGFLPAATLLLGGQLTVDPSLVARVSDLRVDGEGITGNIAAGLIRSRVVKNDGKTLSLLGLPLDGLKIRDVRFVAQADTLALQGTFAG